MYATLDRLEKTLASRLEEGKARAGRARRYYRVTAAGIKSLNESKAALEQVWQGTKWPLESKACFSECLVSSPIDQLFNCSEPRRTTNESGFDLDIGIYRCGRVWLAVMENILKHAGYAERTVIATCIAMQGLATLLLLLRDGRLIFRVVVLMGAAGIALLGASAIKRILDAPHFEGFVLLIGSALMVQGLLTLTVVLRTSHAKTL